MTFGTVAKRIFLGFASEPMKPSHSWVTTKVMRSSGFLEARNLQKFIIGFMCPRPGNGIATTWIKAVDSTLPEESMAVIVNLWFCWYRPFFKVKDLIIVY